AATSRKLRTARAHGESGARVTLRLRLSRAQRARARRTRAAGGRVTAAVTLTGRDASGNARRTSQRIRLR
ncbi:MAG: hypothetical protein ACJ76T_14200, partial [Solirubrobacteraceae bacterium]